jgi:hypothetical protein
MKQIFLQTYGNICLKLSPWEVSSCSATQEFLNILWNPEVHHHVHKELVPILNQKNLVHNTPSYVSKTHFLYYPCTYV